MAGGETEDFARARPLLEAMGEVIVHVGALGQGEMLKLINNSVGAANAAALAEGLLLAHACGLDLDAFAQVLSSGSGASAQLDLKAGAMRAHDYTPALFKTAHMLKDVRLCLEEAQAAGMPFPAAAHARDLLAATVGRGHGEEDYAAISRPPRASPGGELGVETAMRPARDQRGHSQRPRAHQTIVAPEQLLADRQRRHADHPACVGFVGGCAQRLLDLRVLRRLARRAGVEAGLLGGCHNPLRDTEVATVLEGVAEGLQRKRLPTAHLEGEGGDAHREQVVARPRIRPAQLGQPVRPRAPLHLLDPRLARAGSPTAQEERPLALNSPPSEIGCQATAPPPIASPRRSAVRIRIRRAKIEVKG